MNGQIIHYAAIAAAVIGVFVNNWQNRRSGRAAYWASMVLTVAFCFLCFKEVGWTGLFLSVFSPNVTDILNSVAKRNGGK